MPILHSVSVQYVTRHLLVIKTWFAEIYKAECIVHPFTLYAAFPVKATTKI